MTDTRWAKNHCGDRIDGRSGRKARQKSFYMPPGPGALLCYFDSLSTMEVSCLSSFEAM